MLKVFIAIGVILAAVLVLLLGYAATMPDTFRVERSIVIDASPEAIYAEIEDFRRWRAWSPYEEKDPNLKRTYSGAESGVGAAYAWEGDSNVGSGRMTIVEAAPSSRIAIDLEFTSPMEARNKAIFTMTPEEDGTRLVWAMEGSSSCMFRFMGIFIDMDKMIGGDFEAGLAAMKTNVEQGDRA
jgi:uncharacterized protein YndB with AHSA1/START domain